MLLRAILGCLAVLSLVLLLWQWFVARRFPLHRRVSAPSFFPAVTLLKPLKGCDETTEACLRSWLTQAYPGPVQVLFGVAVVDDPVCALVRRLLLEFPACDAQLIVCGPLAGANLKVSKLAQLEALAKHDVLIISDADVRVPPDFLVNVVAPLHAPEVGLVNCFYRLANPTTAAMRWEGVAINVDFWSQVLQAQSLKPMDFALGAVMATRRQQIEAIGGFAALADCLADDYQLGNRIARRGSRIALSPVVVECWSGPMTWAAVWRHQLRWARTIRVCQPVPYFFSILSNPTLWPLIFLAARPDRWGLLMALGCGLVRVLTAMDLRARLEGGPSGSAGIPAGDSEKGNHGLTNARSPGDGALALVKDILQAAIWLLAFTGNRVEWRGERMRLRRDGTLVKR